MRTVAFTLFLLVLINPLFAYIDPGTGSYIVQLIIGGSITILFIIKSQFRRIGAFLRRGRRSPEQGK